METIAEEPNETEMPPFATRNLLTHALCSWRDHLAYNRANLANNVEELGFTEAFQTKEDGEVKASRNLKHLLGISVRAPENSQWGTSLWPPLREYVQNIVDALNLVDKYGFLHPWIEVEVVRWSVGDISAKTLRFKVLEQSALAGACSSQINLLDITVQGPDKLVFRQHMTCPLSPLTLISGVADTHKEGNPAQTGHFGCGQKEAWRQLKGVPGCKLINEMWGNETQRVHQEVHIQEPTLSSRRHVVPHELYVRNKSKEGPRHRKETYVYQQTIELEGIVQSFMDEVVSRFAFFDREAVQQNWIGIADGCGADGSCRSRVRLRLHSAGGRVAGADAGHAVVWNACCSSGLFVTTRACR